MKEKLVEKCIVTEWKDDCIYRTKSLGEEWVPIETVMYKHNDKGEFYCSLSTSRTKELNGKDYR